MPSAAPWHARRAAGTVLRAKLRLQRLSAQRMPLADSSMTWAALSLVIRFGPDGTLPPGIEAVFGIDGQEHDRQIALQELLLVDGESGFAGSDRLQEARRQVEGCDLDLADLADFLHRRDRRLAGGARRPAP